VQELNLLPHEPLRLSKLMGLRGICSRREADDYIQQGWVFVDGQRVQDLGIKVLPSARITLAKEALMEQKSLWTIMLNKPVGYVSAQPEKGYIPAIRLVSEENIFRDQPGISQIKKRLQEDFSLKGMATVGRLDIDSQGLLLFTQDGRLAKKIIGNEADVEKEYLVRVGGYLSDSNMKLLRHGLELDGRPLKPAQVEWINQDQLRFVLKEGRKRQIRRMCEMVGLQVRGLKRVRIGGLKLGPLPEGQWRIVSPEELLLLKF